MLLKVVDFELRTRSVAGALICVRVVANNIGESRSMLGWGCVSNMWESRRRQSVRIELGWGRDSLDTCPALCGGGAKD